MAIASVEHKYESTVRMDGELADRLEVISQVRRQSKNSLIVAAITQFVTDVEDDPAYRQERKEMLDRWSGQEGQ